MNNIDFQKLWEANKNRRWIKKLINLYNYKNKDSDTINYWIEQYKIKLINDPLIISSRKTLEIADGNHRLVALHKIGFDDLVPVRFAMDYEN